MGEPIRAGGYVIRESGWELEHPPRPAEPAALQAELAEPPAVNVETGDKTPAGQALPPVDQADADQDRAECPDCGKDVALRKDGTLRKHTCVIEATPPAVTFEQGDEVDGGDSAAEGW